MYSTRCKSLTDHDELCRRRPAQLLREKTINLFALKSFRYAHDLNTTLLLADWQRQRRRRLGKVDDGDDGTGALL